MTNELVTPHYALRPYRNLAILLLWSHLAVTIPLIATPQQVLAAQYNTVESLSMQ